VVLLRWCLAVGLVLSGTAVAQAPFVVAGHGHAVAVVVSDGDADAVKLAAGAFAEDVARVSGVKPEVGGSLPAASKGMQDVVVIGTVGHSAVIDRLRSEGKLDTTAIEGKWESSVTTVVDAPFAGVRRALVIAGSDRRGTAFAVFAVSRKMGVSPWEWWADVPVVRRSEVTVEAKTVVVGEPTVRYRGIFLNDEDWGLRPWAAKKMDLKVGNIGPRTYERVFELLLRLRANVLWPAMHPGTRAFNTGTEDAELADRWGIVMGSSHSEALLRNNVGEWDEKRDGPWNYQLNRAAIDKYWNQRLVENGKYENVYTVGMRGVHDTGLEATGSAEVKARLVEEVMASQRKMLAGHVNQDLAKVPQIIWLYKESLDLYRAGMKVPDDVTLGWTDDNFGYIRQLPDAEERRRAGGSGIYYHVSYWGRPHDYLWLSSTPPALIREELTKAYDHGARRLWVLNVGDLKPAEADIDYFMQLAWAEPKMAEESQKEFLQQWFTEQFGASQSAGMERVMEEYYRLNFIRKPEFMGFNGYDDGVKRTEFNPLAWGDQNRERMSEWMTVAKQAEAIGTKMPPNAKAAYFELVGYPVEAAAEQNAKFLWTDRSFLDAAQGRDAEVKTDAAEAHAAYDKIGALTAEYNGMLGGKWDGMMSDMPRERHVFEMPKTAADGGKLAALPASWMVGAKNEAAGGEGFVEEDRTVSMNAAHYTGRQDGDGSAWVVMPELGISVGGSVELARPGRLESANWVKGGTPSKEDAWLEYGFTTKTEGEAMLELHLLPTFPVDSEHKLAFAVEIDGGAAQKLDASGLGEWKEDGAAPTWAENVLRNSAVVRVKMGRLAPGRHTVRLIYGDPAVVFEHLVVTFAGAPAGYPVPPETR
jgi:hypothetical protein